MTRRERLEAVIEGRITEELIEDCRRELEKLDERSAKILANTRESARYKENKGYEERVLEILGEEPIQVEEIKEKLGIEMSRQRLTAICTNLVREGRANTVDLKVKGKGKRKGYIKS